MDHGQFEGEGKVMSQVCVGGVDLCDNLPTPEALTAQTRNLNETNTLPQTQSHPPSQNEEGGRCGLIQKTTLYNNGKEQEEVGHGKEGNGGRSREEDEEEDIDEVMKEEEEEESEESSCLIRCQSPDTPMTDSSYSETGSLLETACSFSPGTSPEPTSPVIPVVSPETVHPISSVAPSQSGAEVDSHISNTGSGASTTGSMTCAHGPTFTTGLIDSTSQATTSGTRPTSPAGPTCITEVTDKTAKTPNSSTEQFTSSPEPVLNCGTTCTQGSACSYAGSITSTAEIFPFIALTRPDTSNASTSASATAEPAPFATAPTTTGAEPTSTTGPASSNWANTTSTPVTTCLSVSTCATGPVPSHALLQTLEQLAQRGDDTHLPQYLHQIAEAFVLQKDYQRALWCIQLERLYHQRVLDNLNGLEEQWESQCRRTSSHLATQHLDTLKHICQTHSRPRTRDAERTSVDLLRPTFEECGALPSSTSAHQVEGRMEHQAKDSSCPVIPSINLSDRLNSPEVSENPDRELEGRDGFHGDQLTDNQGKDREREEAEGGAVYTISVTGNGPHPSTAEGMDQSKSAEQQEEDLGSAQEKVAKKKVEEAAEDLEMEDEGEEEEGDEKQKKTNNPFYQKACSVETLVCGAEVEAEQLHLDALAQEEIQESAKPCLHQEAHLPPEAHINQQEQCVEEEEEEEEEEYEVHQLDILREAHSLDTMAKLISVEETSPTSGLVSILKKRRVCVDNVSVSASSETQPEKPTATRRVRFKVPNDSYDHEVGGGDSCLLLFLLCLVTVVISVGGTALYCALGDAQSSVCQDFSRNADFYIGQIQRGITQIQHWFAPGS